MCTGQHSVRVACGDLLALRWVALNDGSVRAGHEAGCDGAGRAGDLDHQGLEELSEVLAMSRKQQQKMKTKKTKAKRSLARRQGGNATWQQPNPLRSQKGR